ncbi:hypothetical protein IWQ62_000791 [Dispira parvispora]|uniref:Uncharacterized protein n=1 Tax=Dispira parvispora TaxID=1520584 RepID=A0A9W8E9T0_9FUNG|nr:hypothetical protein IWQ62_000791 [Dispira parvispora]
MAMTACPHINPTASFDFSQTIQSLSDDDFLSILSNDIQQVGYWMHTYYRNDLLKFIRRFILTRPALLGSIQPLNHKLGIVSKLSDVDSEKLGKFKVLSSNNLPVAPVAGRFDGRYFVRDGFPTDYVVIPQRERELRFSESSVDVYGASGMLVFDTSPLAFLLRENRFVESQIFVQEFHRRMEEPNFLLAFDNASKPFIEIYQPYYSRFSWVPLPGYIHKCPLKQCMLSVMHKNLKTLLAATVLHNFNTTVLDTFVEHSKSFDELTEFYNWHVAKTVPRRFAIRNNFRLRFRKPSHPWHYEYRRYWFNDKVGDSHESRNEFIDVRDDTVYIKANHLE